MLRFASSPTGDMHIGDLRVAIFNYITSKQRSEELVVRIDDTDKKRNIEGKDTEILDILALFGIEYSQVIHQSQNVRFHTAMALQLMHEKKAFSCFCSPNWLEKKHEEAKEAKKAYKYDDACRDLHPELVIDNTSPFTIRINRPDDTIVIKDLVKGDVSFKPDAVDSIGNKPSQEIFNMKDAIEWFDLEKISKSPAHFDIDMLKHINKEHLKTMDAKELSRYVGFADAEIGELARIYLEEVKTTKELKSKIAPIFSERNIPEEFKEQTALMAETIKGAPYFDKYDDFKNYIMKESGLEGENFFQPLRILLTNAEYGPDIAEIYKYLKNYIGEIIK